MKKLRTQGMMGMHEMEMAVLYLFEKTQKHSLEFVDVRFNSETDYSTLDRSQASGMWNLATHGWLWPDTDNGSSHIYFKPSTSLIARVTKRTTGESKD
jgi:hypothetical protein